MQKTWSSIAIGVLAGVLAACGGQSAPALPEAPGAAAGSPAQSGAGSFAPTEQDNTAVVAGTPACVPGIPATSQIPRLLNRQYEAVVRDLLGVTSVGMSGEPLSDLLVADSDGPLTPDAWRIYKDVAGQIAQAVLNGPNRSRFLACDPAAAGCMEQTIRSFGRKAFRRPLSDEEATRFSKLGQTQPTGTPEQVAETTLLAFLVSPSFLLLPELAQTPDPMGMGVRLSSYEVATRLSLLLWGSIPDDALNAAADADQLQTPAQVLAQAQRMLAVRERAGPLIAAFHRDWAQMNNANAHWWKVDHDKTRFPLYSAQAKASLHAELDAFFEEVAFTDGTFEDLLLSDVGFVDQQTAALYGLDPADYGTSLSKVKLDPAQRPGFMTRAGFLSSYAGYDATSPILRGAFIAVYMLGVDPGPPLPGATSMTVSGAFATQRAYVEALTEHSPCAGCHAIINPPGFVLERYDAIGTWQSVDPRGGAIDASVTTARVNLGDGNMQTIATPAELMHAIAQTPKARRLYARAWVTYAFGRAPTASDACLVEELSAKLARPDYTIVNLVADLTQADSFMRRVRSTP